MTAEKVKRKLTAIPSADVKRYSRLISEDKESTQQRLSMLGKVKRMLRRLSIGKRYPKSFSDFAYDLQ